MKSLIVEKLNKKVKCNTIEIYNILKYKYLK